MLVTAELGATSDSCILTPAESEGDVFPNLERLVTRRGKQKLSAVSNQEAIVLQRISPYTFLLVTVRMSSGTLPTVLLIPGALTTPACYDLLLPHLQQAGLSVHIAALPSSNPPNPDEHSAATDGEYLLDQYLLPLVNDGKDVIVFAHSFSATCLSGAGRRLSKAERIAKGLRGGVVGLIYISFAMVPEGQSQFEYLGNIWPAFVRLDHVGITQVVSRIEY